MVEVVLTTGNGGGLRLGAVEGAGVGERGDEGVLFPEATVTGVVDLDTSGGDKSGMETSDESSRRFWDKSTGAATSCGIGTIGMLTVVVVVFCSVDESDCGRLLDGASKD